jgi:acetyl-CoA carboxylase biotin carboxyl carrier protein
VGTFYSASAPGEEAHVSVGARVKRDTVVCIIEAMKVMNHITADVEGTVTEILVRNGDAVEFNQPLFRVKI